MDKPSAAKSVTCVFHKSPWARTTVSWVDEAGGTMKEAGIFSASEKAHDFLVAQGYASDQYWYPGPYVKVGKCQTFLYYLRRH